MPSVILNGQSGGQPILSGNVYSGRGPGNPVQGLVQLRFTTPVAASGQAYVGLSGGVTVNSGTVAGMSGGLLDGLPLRDGDSFAIPKLAFNVSGLPNVFVACDPGVSGVGRLYFEIF